MCPLTAMGRSSKVGQRQWPPPVNRGLFKKDTSNKYVEKIEYRRTIFTKKWKTLKSQAETLASQTGAENKNCNIIPTAKKR